MRIRLWKLGRLSDNHRGNIIPTSDQVNKFRELLQTLPKEEGVVDLVWGPEVTCEVINTDSPYVFGASLQEFKPVVDEPNSGAENAVD